MRKILNIIGFESISLYSIGSLRTLNVPFFVNKQIPAGEFRSRCCISSKFFSDVTTTTLEKALYHYPTLIGVCADQGYRGTFKNTFEIFHNIKVDISPRIKNEFEIQPVRWVVERTFGWMTWSRRLSKDYEIRTFYQENICIISNLQTLLRRF